MGGLGSNWNCCCQFCGCLDLYGYPATAVASAAEDLPALVNRANAAILQAEATLKGYEATSPFAREAQTALRDIQAAADAVTSLSRALERRPNSIILGR